jgi:hypothetical protein
MIPDVSKKMFRLHLHTFTDLEPLKMKATIFSKRREPLTQGRSVTSQETGFLEDAAVKTSKLEKILSVR